MVNKKLLSLVLPSYNESSNLPHIVADLQQVISSELGHYKSEIIIINDGSRDDTWQTIKRLAQKNKSIIGINLSRNFGHQCALEAGLNQARGEAIIMMDADGQHPPKLIPKLVREWEEGYEIVNTIRYETEGESFLKRVTSRMFYRLINKFADTHIIPGAADFRLIDKKVLSILNDLPEQSKFYRGLVSWIGFKTIFIRYRAKKRLNGQTSYTLKKMYKFATDGLTGFSGFPLRIAKYIGLFILLSGFLGLSYMVIATLLGLAAFPTWVFLISIMYFLYGLLFVVLWFIGNYIGRIYFQLKGRPNFIISDIVGKKRT